MSSPKCCIQLDSVIVDLLEILSPNKASKTNRIPPMAAEIAIIRGIPSVPELLGVVGAVDTKLEFPGAVMQK